VDAVVINKVDLLPYVHFDMAAFRKLVSGMNPDVCLFEVSCETGQGIDEWVAWIIEQREKRRRT